MKNVLNYPHIIFDCDGVLLDSNELKRQAILRAACEIVSPVVAEEFTDYFCEFNGAPRLDKALRFFSDQDVATEIIERYNLLLQDDVRPKPTVGAESLLAMLFAAGIRVSVLSGGEEEEVRRFLKVAGLDVFCEGIFGGPSTKQENLVKFPDTAHALYVGDSKVDFELARVNNLEFIFLTQYSQVKDIDVFISNAQVTSCRNLRELKCLKWE